MKLQRKMSKYWTHCINDPILNQGFENDEDESFYDVNTKEKK